MEKRIERMKKINKDILIGIILGIEAQGKNNIELLKAQYQEE